MNSRLTKKQLDGFDVYQLSNGLIHVAVAPQIGAKITSLVNHRTNREWMWAPSNPIKLCRNNPGDSFEKSTFVGADECFPTISVANVGGKHLPDHGALWTADWQLDEAALRNGIIKTGGIYENFKFNRSINLNGSHIELDYEVTNTGSDPSPWLWSFHPLLRITEGDELILPDEAHQLLIEVARQPDAKRGEIWNWPTPQRGVDLNKLQLAGNDAYVKAYAGPLKEGWAEIKNVSKDRLRFQWHAKELPYLGIWLSRGGYKGFHHLAIEPTNTPFDSLAEAIEKKKANVIAAGATVHWQLLLSLGED